MTTHAFNVSVDDQVFVGDVAEEVGAVRKVEHDHLFVFIENAGEFRIDGSSVLSAHDGKVVLDPAKLDAAMMQAIGRAHARETR